MLAWHTGQYRRGPLHSRGRSLALILVDANLLIYAGMRVLPQHAIARRWLDQVLNHEPRVGLPWNSILAFLRIVTNPRAFSPPPTMEQAWQQIRDWLEVPAVWIPLPTESHMATLERLMPYVTAAHLVTDAHVAALAIEHGLTIYSADGDFARFPGVRSINPLLQSKG
ncbi:MAG: TA system VapC family ribonuclease toxin [Candidatus Xenobia bacterium]